VSARTGNLLAGASGAVTLALFGVGVPLAFGSPGLGILLVTLAVFTGGLTIHAWLARETAPAQGSPGVAGMAGPGPPMGVAGAPAKQSVLCDRLLGERERGQRLLPGLSAFAPQGVHRRTTKADVDAWEATVRHLLSRHPELLSIFNFDPRTPMAIALSRSAVMTGGETGARLRLRLTQLGKVIEGF